MDDIIREQREINIKWLRETVEMYMRHRDLSGARSFVENFPLEIKRKITQPSLELSVDAQGLLYTAVITNNVMFIRFLVEECNADIEEKYNITRLPEIEGDRPTPLWFAFWGNNIEAVEELIRLGANVNAIARIDGESILHEVCRLGDLSTATCLINNGANVTKTDNDGFTALMRAVKSVDICRLLIENGARVNVANKYGNSALHLAACERETETVKLLLKNGADILLKNDSGDDSLRLACIHCASVSVKLMLAHLPEWDVRREIEAYQLLGACYLTYPNVNHNIYMYKAFDHWKFAIQLRDEMRHAFVDDDVVITPNPAYHNAVEIDSISKLNEIRQDMNMMQMQSLLLQEKILGPSHWKTISSLRDGGNLYMRNEDYGRGLRLLRRGFKLSCDLWFQHRSFRFCISSYAPLNLNAVKTRLDFQDVYEFLETVTFEAKRFANAEENAEENAVMKSKLDWKLRFSEILCHLIILFSHLNISEDQMFQFKKLVHDFIRLNLRFNRERTLLMDIIYTQNTDFIMSNVYRVDIVELLLDCGADVGQEDVDGYSALHLLALSADSLFDLKDDSQKQVAEILLASGAHFDARNKNGFTPVPFLKGLKIDLSTLMTLQCLAAQVIRRNKIPCEGILSKCLIDFVEMH